MLDFGYPQTTEPKILQEYITQEMHQLDLAPRPPMAVTNAVSWRSEGIKYRKNEVYNFYFSQHRLRLVPLFT